MDLTVCICTCDRPRYVRDCLDGLRRQTISRDRFTVLLVDSASAPVAAASEMIVGSAVFIAGEAPAVAVVGVCVQIRSPTVFRHNGI